MVKHMSPKEQDSVRKWVAHDKMTATQAAARLAKQRLKRGEEPLEDNSVYRFVSGKTHQQTGHETRGRKPALSAKDIRALLGGLLVGQWPLKRV